MAVKKGRKSSRRKTPKKYRFQLSLSGITSVAIVSLCLFLWMFLLGIWAGQTILLPSSGSSVVSSKVEASLSAVDEKLQKVLPRGKKKQVSQK